MLNAAIAVGTKLTAGLTLSGVFYGIDTAATFTQDATLVPSGVFAGIDPSSGAGFTLCTDLTGFYGLL